MSIKKQLGLRIRELRIKAGLIQSELAEAVNIDPKHQSCIETGRNFPSSELIEKYANVFQIEASEILKLQHIKERKLLIKEINDLIKIATDEQITLIHKIINDVVR